MMDDLSTAMLALVFCSLMLVTGQQYLSKRPEITAATAAQRPHIAANGLPGYRR
jgi:hypothetical protein